MSKRVFIYTYNTFGEFYSLIGSRKVLDETETHVKYRNIIRAKWHPKNKYHQIEDLDEPRGD